MNPSFKAPGVEASTISRSISDVSTNANRQLLIAGKTKKFDMIFPLYDQIFQKIDIPPIIYHVMNVFVCFQFILIAFWPFSPFWTEDPKTNTKFLEGLSQGFWLTRYMPESRGSNRDYIQIMFAVILIILVVSILFIVALFINYNQNHRFHEWSLYLMKIVTDGLSILLILPSASLFGSCLMILIDHNHIETGSTSIFWLFLILSAVALIVFNLMFYYSYSLQCHSVYLHVHSYSSFDPKPACMSFIIGSAFVIVQYFFTIFPEWCLVVAQIIHLLLMGYTCYNLRFLTFHYDLGNVILASTFSASAFNDIIMIIARYAKFPFYVPIITFFVVMIALSITFYFVLRSYTKKIVAGMQDSDLTEEERNDYLEKNKLNVDLNKAIMYMRRGFMGATPFFATFALPKYVALSYNTVESISASLQLLSYFPCESRLMNSLLTQLCSKQNLSFYQRFLIYEVYHLNTLRQSSVSSSSNETLNELKNNTLHVETFVRSYFVLKEPNVYAFEEVSIRNKKCQSLWQEGIYNYPNNSEYYEEYSRFLIECPSDFYAAVLQRRSADLIDIGHNFAIDHSFIKMIQNYPEYIKKGIIDTKGNIRLNAKAKKDETISSSGSENTDHSSTMRGVIDQEVEDSVGKLIIHQSKMRLALHHSITGRTLTPTKILPFALALAFIAFIACFISIFVYLMQSFVTRKTSMNRISYISKARFYMALCDNCIFLRFVNMTGRFLNQDILTKDYEVVDKGLVKTMYINLSTSFETTIIKYMNECRHYYTLITDELADLSTSGENVYEMAAPIFENLVNITLCYNVSFLQPQPATLKDVIVFALFSMAQMANYNDTVSWYNSSVYCDVIKNWDMTMVGSGMVFQSLTDDQHYRFQKLQKVLRIMMIVYPVCLFIVSFVPVLAITLCFYRDLKLVSKIIIDLPTEVKAKAMKPIRNNLGSREQSMDTIEIKSKFPRHMKCLIAYGFVSAFASIFSLLMLIFANITNDNINTLNKWQYYCCQRLSLACECFHMIITAPILNKSIDIEFMSQQSEVELGTEWMNNLDAMNEGLLQGDPSMDSPPCFGFDDQLDRINLQEACTLEVNDTSLHDTYRCSSANQGIAAFRDFVTEICNDPDSFNGAIGDDITLNFLHLANAHLWDRLEESINRIFDLAVIHYNKMITNEIIILVFGIILAITTLVFGVIIHREMRIATDGAISLIKRLHPLDIVNNKALMNILLNKKSMEKDHDMSIDQSIIHNSFDSIICTSMNGVIEIVNPSVTNLLGYTPEQLLGQQPKMLFNEEFAESVDKQMDLMREKQSGSVYEDLVTTISDSGNEIPCHMTILLMSSTGSGEPNSFVIILRDETELTNQQKAAEEAKAQSENLLFQILPRDIVTRLNQGEKDISFTVQSATIIFIDIVKFSEYSSMLTPQEIMGNLSLVFAAFDSILKKYELILKIKLIGDVYMAAAGLFNPEAKPQQHAEQTIRFALECLMELDEVNVKLNANLCVRIGVNSGGPLLAGVLGTDKPVFDIIGDPINIASRLQSTDIPGCIQIPQSTLDLISDLDFCAEPRGEVYLKGKGKCMTFLVKPSTQFTENHLSSEEN
ncbi:hypothetical protein M9Y10_013044 [Tritrichomonas musculus]|uniref:Adenylate and Guanylate cyclase catalytic domain containing protein n=1 Tax=Tritrichomonas musculus TaxID=1915356 RepID=A0ABR2I8K6_9EUKA